MKALLISVFLLFAVSFFQPAHSATFDVTDSAGFQTALSSASSNGEDNTINLAAGTYSSVSGFSYTATNHVLTIVGAGSDSTILQANSSIGISFAFSGTVTVSGIHVQDTSSVGNYGGLVFSDIAGSVYNIVVHDCNFSQLGDSAITITNAAVSGSINIYNNLFEQIDSISKGAGLNISTSATVAVSVAVRNNIFSNNAAFDTGGGVIIVTSGPSSPITLTGNTFDTNSASNEGGAASLTNDNSDSLITVGGLEEGEGNSFTGNEALSFGGLKIYSLSGVNFVGNSVIDNHADPTTGSGGGVYVTYVGPGEFSNNLIQDNSAQFVGGFQFGTSFSPGTPTTLNVNANLISGNVSYGDYGGGIVSMYTMSSPAVISNNIIVDNHVYTANGSVGGLSITEFLADQDIYVINNTFANNTAEVYYAGGLMITPGAANIGVNLSNNIFWENTSPQAMKDFWLYSPAAGWDGLVFDNNNITDICVDAVGGVTTCNTGDDFSALPGTTSSTGNLNPYSLYNIDPQFFALGGLADYYSLQADSPMIQAGTAGVAHLPEFDYTGTVPMDTPNPDLGALQYCVPSLSLTITPNADTITLGDNVTWTVALIDSAHCASNDNTLTLSFTNSEFQSGSLVSASLTRQLLSVFAAASVACTGSGNSAVCTISQIAADSTVDVSIVGNTIALGTIGLSASLSNSLATASASGSGTASVVAAPTPPTPTPSPDSLSGAGCSLNSSSSENHFSFWMFASILLLPLFKKPARQEHREC